MDLPPSSKPLGYKWIFKKKMKADESIDKYKASLVIKCYKQKEGLDYFDTYSPVTRISSIRMLIAIAAIHNLEINQMDVKTTFLNGDLDEEIYMEQPEGFIPIWPQPMPAICIHCDSQSVIGRAHSHIYNSKSQHIRRRHNTIRQLLSNGIMTIEYIRSKENIADPLTKGLTREQVSKSSRGMGLKPIH